MSRSDKIALIIQRTASAFEVDALAMTAKGRRGPAYLSRSRQVAMWLITLLLDTTYSECAHAVGKKHHATVLYGVRQVHEQRRIYQDFKATTDRLYNELKAEFSTSAEE